ncbi:MAG: hypothetical protein HQK91_03385 [Nitrospirae bacterium]|nr:hypothetical protein [Nitrospirota bacterium]MBF0540479.1 hypothetical protein [Nitrospirota bacterium]
MLIILIKYIILLLIPLTLRAVEIGSISNRNTRFNPLFQDYKHIFEAFYHPKLELSVT